MSYSLLNNVSPSLDGIIQDNTILNNNALKPQSIYEVNRILDRQKYNGRVNILEPEDPDMRFRMFEKIAAKNKSIEYRDALEGNWEHNVLSQVYFSAENMQIIQNALRAGVYAMSQNLIIVPPQNVDALRVIMRSIYLQYAQHYPKNITQQVEQLNAHVLDYSIPFVFNEAIAYKKYLEDQSTLVMPLQHPVHHDRQYKQLELKPWF
jgi:hypothetical protein